MGSGYQGKGWLMAKDDAKHKKAKQKNGMTLRWLDDVVAHDFDSALAYLSLKFDEKQAADAVDRLRKAEVTRRRANDILRACSLTAAPLVDEGVIARPSQGRQGQTAKSRARRLHRRW